MCEIISKKKQEEETRGKMLAESSKTIAVADHVGYYHSYKYHSLEVLHRKSCIHRACDWFTFFRLFFIIIIYSRSCDLVDNPCVAVMKECREIFVCVFSFEFSDALLMMIV